MSGNPGRLRLLTRHFLRRFVDNDLIAPGQDLHASLAAVLAAFLIVSATVALAFISKYNGYAAQSLSLADKLAMALDDKTLLLGGAMIVMALATVLAWDSLSLDARDFAILGPLPIRPATLLTAKTVALSAAVLVAAIGLNILPALLFPVVVLAKANVGLIYGLRAMAALLVAGMMGCAFTFAALASVRMLLTLALPEWAARRLLPVLQFVLLLALLTLLLMVPLLANGTRLAIAGNRSVAYLSPAVWFLGLEEVLIGRREPIFLALTRLAGIAFAATIVVAGLGYVGGFIVHQRRFRSQAPVASRSTAAMRASILRRLAARVAPDGLTRATFYFTAHTLARSPRHRLCVAGHLGLGLACVAASILAAHFGVSISRTPLDLTSMAFAAQGNLIFFLLVGVRVAAGFPADLNAAWLFRMTAGPGLRRYQAGTRWAFVLLGVLPLLILLVPLHAVLWGWYAALVHFAVGSVMALSLLDFLFRRSDRIPFVTAFAPARTVLSLRLPFYIFGYLLFVYLPPELEYGWIRNPHLLVAWVALFVLVVAKFLESQSSLLRHDTRMPAFEGEEEVQTLGLTGWACGDTEAGPASPIVQTSEGPSIPAAPPTRWFNADAGVPAAAAPVGLTARLTSWRPLVEQVGQDARFALRRLRTAPAFTLFAAITLALGIGATTAIYSIIDTAILTPPDIRHIDYVVNLYHSDPHKGGNRSFIGFSLPDFEDLRASQTVFSHLVAWTPAPPLTLVANGTGESALGELVTGDYFTLVGVLPRLGRLLQPADDRPDAPAVAVLSDDIWQRRFAGDPTVVGKSVRMNGHPFQVVGVARAPFRGVFSPSVIPTSVWVPLQHATLLGAVSADALRDREDRWLFVKGFLRWRRTVADAAAEVKVIGCRLDAAYPIGRDVPAQWRWTPSGSRAWWMATPAADVHVHESVDSFVLPFAAAVMAAVGLVLLVACSNLANLMLARGASRRQELAVRLALGASRRRLIGEQIVESGVVALLGACGAVMVARLIMAWAAAIAVPIGSGIALHVAPGFNLSVAIVSVGATALALLVFGLAPAIQLTRTDVRSAMSADTANVAVPRWRGRGNLIAAQVAVSVSLLAAAAIYGRDVMLSSLRTAGLDLDRAALVRLDFGMQGYDEVRGRQTLERILEVASRDRGAEVAAVTSGVPTAIENDSASVTAPDRPVEQGRNKPRMPALICASPGIFRALGVRILRGRAFDARDTSESGPVVVLTERAARAVYGTVDAVGRAAIVEARHFGENQWRAETATVVGIAADPGGTDGERNAGAVYRPFAQQFSQRVTIVARARASDAAALAARLRLLTLRVDPELAILDAGTGVALTQARMVFSKMIAGLAAVLALLALALAMAGLYGVLSYIVAGRTREIGVRMALGATRPRILFGVLYDGLRPVLAGVATGLGLAALGLAALQPFVTRVMPAVDPLTFSLLPIPFLVAALVACFLPARRAASVDPNIALRQL